MEKVNNAEVQPANPAATPAASSPTPTATESFECAVCDVKTSEDLRCARCRLITYCSAKCQKEDWPEHKKECRTLEQRKAMFEQTRFLKYRAILQKISGNICIVAAHYGRYTPFLVPTIQDNANGNSDTPFTSQGVKLLYGAVRITVPESTASFVNRPTSTYYAYLNWVEYEQLTAEEQATANKLFTVTATKSVHPEEEVLVIFQTRDRTDFLNISLDPKDKLTIEKIRSQNKKPGEDWMVVVNL
jgi:hypothetical protein